jgi:hypothetical protein
MSWLDNFFQVAPRITAFLSIAGSAFIVSDVLGSEKKRSLTYHRIMLGMSTCDLVASVSYFLGRWPLPKNDPSFSGGRGTTHTCTAQGFFGQFVLSTVGYNTSLAVYYFLVISKGWKKDRVRRAEIWLHVFSNSLWIITGVVGIVLEIFNAALFNCWVCPSPYDCHETGEPCVRGEIANYFQWVFYYGPIFVMIVVVTLLMLAVYSGVLKREKRVERYSFGENSQERAKRKRSKQVAIQGMWYLAPFYLTWIFPVTYQLTAVIGNTHVPALSALTGFFIPFQGVLNFIVYMRPRYLRYKRKHEEVEEALSIERSARKSCFAGISSGFWKSRELREVAAAEAVDEIGLSPDDSFVENGRSNEPTVLSAISNCKESLEEECKEESGEAVAADAVDDEIGLSPDDCFVENDLAKERRESEDDVSVG